VLDKPFVVCYNNYTEEMMKERDMMNIDSPLSLGEVTSIHDNGMIEVNFDDQDGYTLFRPNEIRTDYATSNKIGVYIDNFA
jgi:hypothetical protein